MGFMPSTSFPRNLESTQSQSNTRRSTFLVIFFTSKKCIEQFLTFNLCVSGSPFQFTVGPLRDGGAHRVHAGGPGIERGEQGQPCEFNVWTREAGAGSLAISVEGPSKAEIDFKDRKDGSCYVSYTVAEQGQFKLWLSLFFGISYILFCCFLL